MAACTDIEVYYKVEFSKCEVMVQLQTLKTAHMGQCLIVVSMKHALRCHVTIHIRPCDFTPNSIATHLILVKSKYPQKSPFFLESVYSFLLFSDPRSDGNRKSMNISLIY
jgi:hypothetical protein